MGHSVPAAGAADGICRSPNCPAPAGGSPAVPQGRESPGRLPSCVPSRSQRSCLDSKSLCGGGLNKLMAAHGAATAGYSMFSTAGRTPSSGWQFVERPILAQSRRSLQRGSGIHGNGYSCLAEKLFAKKLSVSRAESPLAGICLFTAKNAKSLRTNGPDKIPDYCPGKGFAFFKSVFKTSI